MMIHKSSCCCTSTSTSTVRWIVWVLLLCWVLMMSTTFLRTSCCMSHTIEDNDNIMKRRRLIHSMIRDDVDLVVTDRYYDAVVTNHKNISFVVVQSMAEDEEDDARTKRIRTTHYNTPPRGLQNNDVCYVCGGNDNSFVSLPDLILPITTSTTVESNTTCGQMEQAGREGFLSVGSSPNRHLEICVWCCYLKRHVFLRKKKLTTGTFPCCCCCCYFSPMIVR
jgi:hypothetical protein